jgi:peroxiredoxin
VSRWRRSFVAVALLLGLWLAGCSEPQEVGTASPGAAPDAGVAMDFTLPDLEGKPVSLSDYRGKTVVLDFWATWCPPCIFQVPELNSFWKANGERGDVMVIGVAVDVEGARVVAPWAKEHGVVYQLVIGTEDVARDFGAVGFPTLVVLRPDGAIDSRHVGLIESQQLEEIVAAARGAGPT